MLAAGNKDIDELCTVHARALLNEGHFHYSLALLQIIWPYNYSFLEAVIVHDLQLEIKHFICKKTSQYKNLQVAMFFLLSRSLLISVLRPVLSPPLLSRPIHREVICGKKIDSCAVL